MMISLDKDLQTSKNTIEEFAGLTSRILSYLPNVISGYNDKNDYRLYHSQIAGTIKYLRPVNITLFIEDEKRFKKEINKFKNILNKIKDGSACSGQDKLIINAVIYTIQQSIGVGFDLLANPNSARKHVGNRFEELMKAIFTNIGIANEKIVLQIPYETDDGDKTYRCENDLILSPFNAVKSNPHFLHEKEVVVSIKTTSKDRMGKIFIDKMLLEKFVGHPQKVIGIFLNDVQRKGDDNISYTLVSNLFMVYTKFLTKLEGIYYIDLPLKASSKIFSKYLKPFSELICNDLKDILSS